MLYNECIISKGNVGYACVGHMHVAVTRIIDTHMSWTNDMGKQSPLSGFLVKYKNMF